MGFAHAIHATAPQPPQPPPHPPSSLLLPLHITLNPHHQISSSVHHIPNPMDCLVSVHILCPDSPQTVWCQSRIPLVCLPRLSKPVWYECWVPTLMCLPRPPQKCLVSVSDTLTLVYFPSSTHAAHKLSLSCTPNFSLLIIRYYVRTSHCACEYLCSRVYFLFIVCLYSLLHYCTCGYLYRQVHITCICIKSPVF